MSASKLRRGLAVQGRVIHALMARELTLRYGRDNIGFLWAVLEPMLLCSGVMVISSVSGSDKGNVGIVELILTGYMPLTLWRHMTNPAQNMFRTNVALLNHRRITLFDMIAGRMALEFISTTTALLLVWSTLNAFGVVGDIQHYDLFFVGWLMMFWMGTVSGALIAVGTEISETAERLVQPIQYLNIPLSGTFFLVDWLPEWGQKLILYHPLIHCYEVFRAGFFGDAIVSHYELGYFSACGLVMTFIAFWALRYIRSRVRLS